MVGKNKYECIIDALKAKLQESSICSHYNYASNKKSEEVVFVNLGWDQETILMEVEKLPLKFDFQYCGGTVSVVRNNGADLTISAAEDTVLGRMIDTERCRRDGI